MATLLADPPAAPTTEQPPAGAPDGATPPLSASPAVQRACAKCGAAMDGAQDWCLHCGAGAPDSLATRAPSWRSAATIIGVLAILVAGAATAAYAALSKSSSKGGPASATVAQTPAATPLASAAPATPGATPAIPKLGAPTTIKPLTPLGGAKPPKIPLTPTATPKIPTTPSTTSSTPSVTPKTTSTGGSTPTAEARPSAILLDTNAAATYNPYAYPAGNFGDPSLAIDGDTSTGWTAQVDPAVAPRMAEGLVIDLKTGQKLSALALVTSSLGMTVQVYGANGHALPASITDPAWVQLSPLQLEKKKHVRIKLRRSTKAFRFVTLWISKAPAASVGTAQAPGHVVIDELELFPFKK